MSIRCFVRVLMWSKVGTRGGPARADRESEPCASKLFNRSGGKAAVIRGGASCGVNPRNPHAQPPLLAFRSRTAPALPCSRETVKYDYMAGNVIARRKFGIFLPIAKNGQVEIGRAHV